MTGARRPRGDTVRLRPGDVVYKFDDPYWRGTIDSIDRHGLLSISYDNQHGDHKIAPSAVTVEKR
jgi:hypothetical protein